MTTNVRNEAIARVMMGGEDKNTIIIEALNREGTTFGDLQAITEIVEPMVVELTKIHGGGVNKDNSDPTMPINTLAEAITLLKSGMIAGFDIGGWIDDIWSPCGRVRKWGSDSGHVQIKEVNFFGQEGSGHYDHIDSPLSKKLLDHLVEKSTIPKDSKLHKIRAERGKSSLSERDCAAKFKAH